MLAELDVIIYLKSDDSIERVAERVFGALGSSYEVATSEDMGGEYYRASGLGLEGGLFHNTGDVLDPEFADYPYALDIQSGFWCVELDASGLEEALSEYYARYLAFVLNVETATEIFLEATEEIERLEIRAYQRNPQYRLDQPPTTPKVLVIEQREVEVPYDEDEPWDEESEEIEEE